MSIMVYAGPTQTHALIQGSTGAAMATTPLATHSNAHRQSHKVLLHPARVSEANRASLRVHDIMLDGCLCRDRIHNCGGMKIAIQP